MLSRCLRSLPLGLLFTSAAMIAASSQPIYPLPMVSREVQEEVHTQESVEKYYRFTARPGLVTLTLDMQTRSESAIRFSIQILNEKRDCLAAIDDELSPASTKRAVKSFTLSISQPLTLKVAAKSIRGVGNCRIRIDGPVDI